MDRHQRAYQHPVGAGMVEQIAPSPAGYREEPRGGGGYPGADLGGGRGSGLGPMFQKSYNDRWM